jgi:hypothetical protein
MKGNHTPGPWLVNPFCAQVDDSDGVPICQLLWPTDERSERETMENANLIMAAPDMLCALKEIALLADLVGDDAVADCIYNFANIAIQKTEGKQ